MTVAIISVNLISLPKVGQTGDLGPNQARCMTILRIHYNPWIVSRVMGGMLSYIISTLMCQTVFEYIQDREEGVKGTYEKCMTM